MENDSRFPKSLITNGALILVAIVGILVERLELPVLQGAGLWTFYAVAGSLFLVTAVQLFVQPASGAPVIRRSSRIMVLFASISLLLQVWITTLLLASLAVATSPNEVPRQPSTDEDDQPPRDRFRRSLSVIALSVTVAIVACVVFWDYQGRANQQQLEQLDQEIEQERVAVAEIQKLGGFCNGYTTGAPEPRVTSVQFRLTVKVIDGKAVIAESEITDDGMVHLKALTDLETLDLNGTRVTDVGLRHLKGLTKLRSLNLENTRVTDAGVVDLKKALPECAISQ